MIIFDDSIVSVFSDYGIMLPIAASRAKKIVDHLAPSVASASGEFPGPVLDIRQALAVLGKSSDVMSLPAASGGVSCKRCLIDEARSVRKFIIPSGLIPNLCRGVALFEPPHRRKQVCGGVLNQTLRIKRADIERVHSAKYVNALFSDGLLGELLNAYELIGADGKPNRYEPDKAVQPLSALFDKILAQCAGAYLACAAALVGIGGRHFCYFLAGGNHHARYDTGAGFCLINEIIIAARKLQAEEDAHIVWIIDVDAHKGCGSAELVSFIRGGKGPAPFEKGCDIFTLSIHMARGWPLDAETLRNSAAGRAPLIPSDVEIPVEEGEEALYVSRLAEGLRKLERLSVKPDIAIVVDGADPYEHDGLLSSALLRLSLDQCVERDMLIYNFLSERKIPSAWILAGGYGERAWEPPYHFLKSLSAQPF